MGLDDYCKDYCLPLVHCGEIVDVGIELGESRVKGKGLLAYQRNENGGLIVKSIDPHLVKGYAKVLVRSRRFSELEYALLDADAVLVMQRIKSKSTHVAEAIKVDWLEFILEDSHNFLQ